MIEKSIVIPSHHNIVHVTFSLESGDEHGRLRLRPMVHFRELEEPVDVPLQNSYLVTARDPLYEISAGSDLPPLRIVLESGEVTKLVADGAASRDFFFESEEQRGYAPHGSAWTPGYFDCELHIGSPVTLAAGTEPWHTILALKPSEACKFELERRQRLLDLALPCARSGFSGELVLAADAFVITPISRVADIARARAEGDEMRTIIAGYHLVHGLGP